MLKKWRIQLKVDESLQKRGVNRKKKKGIRSGYPHDICFASCTNVTGYTCLLNFTRSRFLGYHTNRREQRFLEVTVREICSKYKLHEGLSPWAKCGTEWGFVCYDMENNVCFVTNLQCHFLLSLLALLLLRDLCSSEWKKIIMMNWDDVEKSTIDKITTG